MLRGDISEGDTVKFFYDRDADKVRWEKQAVAEAPTPSAGPGPRGREREAPRPAAH